MSNAIQKAELSEVQVVPAQQSETAAILSMIERAARDPAVDITKIERLMEMRERLESKAAEREFNVAMKNAQAAMKPIAADATNNQTKSKYATYARLDSVLRPIYTKHGFSLSFDEEDSPKPEHVRVVCYVSHEGGFTRTYRKDMPADGKGAKGGDVMTKTHATGAAASYGARYILKGVFNIAVGEEDQDGNTDSSVNEFVTDEQEATLQALIIQKKIDINKFLEWVKAESLSDVLAVHFQKAVVMLSSKPTPEPAKVADAQDH